MTSRTKMPTPIQVSCGLLILSLLTGCAGGPKRPVFYPNSHIQQVGQVQAARDTDDCMALADRYGVSRTRDGEVGSKAAAGALIGGVSAGAWGLVSGNAGERAAAGALAGGSAGAVKGGIDSTRISPTFQSFVQRCLKDRGYEVIGWD